MFDILNREIKDGDLVVVGRNQSGSIELNLAVSKGKSAYSLKQGNICRANHVLTKSEVKGRAAKERFLIENPTPEQEILRSKIWEVIKSL